MKSTHLSEKENNILSSLASGLSNEEISEQQGVSVNTVKFHLKNIYRRLNLKNRVEASGWYRDNCKQEKSQ